jgi:hypothetical protein
MLKQAIAIVVVLTAGVAHAQSPEPTPTPTPTTGGDAYAKGTLGLAFNVTTLATGGPRIIGEAPPTIDLLYFLSDKAALDLLVGVNLHKTEIVSGAPPIATDTTIFGFTVGLGYRMYTHKDKLHTYLEPQVVLSVPDTGAADVTFFAGLNGLFGVERSLADWVSIGGAVGVGLGATNKFKDIQVSTEALLAVNLYWK